MEERIEREHQRRQLSERDISAVYEKYLHAKTDLDSKMEDSGVELYETKKVSCQPFIIFDDVPAFFLYVYTVNEIKKAKVRVFYCVKHLTFR